jgi:hypothetical protein
VRSPTGSGRLESHRNAGSAQEDDVAGKTKKDRIDPAWPKVPDGQHPVSEFLADKQGALSPFGDTTFPLDTVPYTHPETRINK